MDAATRAYIAQLAEQLREAVGDARGKHLGKRERKVVRVARALEEVAK